MPKTWEELAALTEPDVHTELPGPKAQEVLDRDEDHTSPSLPRAYHFVPSHGAGSMLEDVDGNVFLDFNAGIAVNSTGHAHPAVVAAIKKQAEQLLHYSASDFYLPIYSETCERLHECELFTRNWRTFLTNSGTEAVEASIKLARRHTGRPYIISFFGGFHGRTYGSVTLTGSSAKYKQGFAPMLPSVVHAPYADCFNGYTDLNHPDAPDYIENVLFKRLVPVEEVAAIILEPVLGEGGYVVPPKEWIENLRRICDENGILMIADEIQCGMGRTGQMWAIEHFDVEPDILLAGKGIASGLPLGAMIARAGLMTWTKGAHGSTYGGNPVACAAALATLDLVEKELMHNAAEIGPKLIDGFKALQAKDPAIVDVRGLGLMIGIECSTKDIADDIEEECFRRGLLVLGCGDKTVRVSPPLLLNEAQADAGLRIFSEALEEVSGG